jgi:hypothetical protein
MKATRSKRDLLPRFMAHLSEWVHGFTRLFPVTRSALWERIDLLALSIGNTTI